MSHFSRVLIGGGVTTFAVSALAVLFTVGTPASPFVRHPGASVVVPLKMCVQACVDHQFKGFHNNGKSWGTGSSSLTGLQQQQTFDTVLKYCENFYKDERCCVAGAVTDIRQCIHGFSYCRCEEGEK